MNTPLAQIWLEAIARLRMNPSCKLALNIQGSEDYTTFAMQARH
jgi:hypothetical protein